MKAAKVFMHRLPSTIVSITGKSFITFFSDGTLLKVIRLIVEKHIFGTSMVCCDRSIDLYASAFLLPTYIYVQTVQAINGGV